jgi:hypothetical protein
MSRSVQRSPASAPSKLARITATCAPPPWIAVTPSNRAGRHRQLGWPPLGRSRWPSSAVQVVQVVQVHSPARASAPVGPHTRVLHLHSWRLCVTEFVSLSHLPSRVCT